MIESLTITSPISTDTPWLRLDLEEADWRAEDPKALAGWLEQMLLIRRFEEKILDLHSAGLIHGPAHAAIGQEAGAVGAMSALGREDKINGTHRAHHQVLAKLVNAVTPGGYDALAQDFAPDMAETVEGVMAEIMGLKAGFAAGAAALCICAMARGAFPALAPSSAAICPMRRAMPWPTRSWGATRSPSPSSATAR